MNIKIRWVVEWLEGGAVKGTQAGGSQGPHLLSPFELLHKKSNQINTVRIKVFFFVVL